VDVRLNDPHLLRPQAPPAVRWIVETLEARGFETWTVGGAVRDVLLGIPSVDWDLATRARPAEVRRIFRRTVPIGIEHGTVGVLARDGTLYEVTTFRRDVSTTGRHAVVEFADRLEDDLSRRDFTINAVAWHPIRDELSDPFGGIEDLEDRVLRTVGEPERRFAEDYLRVLRALRFAGRFSLEIDPRTWRALVRAVGHLDVLSRERVREELLKVLAADPTPARSLELYRASGALDAIAPELSASVGVPLQEPAPPGMDAWRYGLALAEAISASRPLLRLTALLQAAALAAGDSPARASARGAQLMIRLRFSKAQVERATGLLAAPPRPPDQADPATLRRWLSRGTAERLPDLARLWVARARVLGDFASPGPPGIRRIWCALRRELGRRPPLTLADLALDGRDLIRLGMKPGPAFKAVLEGLLDRVLVDPSLNAPDPLASLVPEVVGALDVDEPHPPEEGP
jgi:tRNA nucleotidyltransferase (CCA-adding enzyme)